MLAGSFDIPSMRGQVLDLATRCDELAKSLEESPPDTMASYSREP